MYVWLHKIIKITRSRVHTVAFDQRSTKNALRFDEYFRTDFLHIGKWYALHLLNIDGHPVIQYAQFSDKDKIIPYTDYQQEIDEARKELGISARNFNRDRKYVLDLLRKGTL